MTFKVIRGQGQGDEMISVPYRDYFLHSCTCDLNSPRRNRLVEFWKLLLDTCSDTNPSVHWVKHWLKILTSLGWYQRTVWCVVSHSVVIVMCTKLDAECDRQAMVVGRLLTTLGDDECAVAKLFLVQMLQKSCCENYTYVERYSNFFICLINILQLEETLSLRPEALDPVEAWPWTLCIGLKACACGDCIDLPPWSQFVSK